MRSLGTRIRPNTKPTDNYARPTNNAHHNHYTNNKHTHKQQ